MPYVKSSRTSAIGSAENSQRVVVHLSKILCQFIVQSTSPVQSPAFTTIHLPWRHFRVSTVYTCLGVILLNTVKGQSALQVMSLAYTEAMPTIDLNLGWAHDTGPTLWHTDIHNVGAKWHHGGFRTHTHFAPDVIWTEQWPKGERKVRGNE